MTSVTAFNDMMGQFICELKDTFPEEKGIKKYAASFDIMRKSNPRKCVEAYMNAIGPYSQRITAKDESIMDETSLTFLNDMNIKKHWTPELSDNTKDAIWQYLQTLYMLGTTITAFPAETLNMIESVANNMAQQMSNGGDGSTGGGQIDEAALMNSVQGLLGNMGNLGNLGNLLGGGKQ